MLMNFGPCITKIIIVKINTKIKFIEFQNLQYHFYRFIIYFIILSFYLIRKKLPSLMLIILIYSVQVHLIFIHV